MSQTNSDDRPSSPLSASSTTDLKQSLSYLQSIFDTVREPLIVLDSTLRVRTANRSFYNTFQVKPEETEHQLLAHLGNGQWNIPSLQRHLESLLAKNTVFEDFEVDHVFQRIGRKVMLLNGRPILQEKTETKLLLLAIEDITVRKQAEETFQLFTAKLEQSNRELQDFAFVASHDLQEPLRKIQAFGDLLNHEHGEHLPDSAKEYLQRIQNAAARMKTLINDLLTFSRVTTKAQNFVPVDLNEIIQGILLDLETQIQQTAAQVDIGTLPTIEADPLQMRQLFQNLLSNSLKFHPNDRSPHIKLYATLLTTQSLADGEADSTKCQITVQDNGIGFDEKYLSKIFTIFQRLHYRDEYEGTGIGLAICRKITERHRGSITASSIVGEGATFVVTLPICQSSEKPACE